MGNDLVFDVMTYSVEEVACMLDITENTVRTWCQSHKLAAYHEDATNIRSPWIIAQSSLVNFIAKSNKYYGYLRQRVKRCELSYQYMQEAGKILKLVDEKRKEQESI